MLSIRLGALACIVLGAACGTPDGVGAADDRAARTSDGIAVDSPLSEQGPPRCTEAKATTQLQPVYLALVVDGSASMTNSSKWDAVVPSLQKFVDALAKKKDRTIGLGLIGFADSKDPTGEDWVYGPYPTAADVPIAYVDEAQATALTARLDTQPTGLTPTLPALEGAYGMLRKFVPRAPLQSDGKKIVVLVTDGYPFTPVLDTDVQVASSLRLAKENATNVDPIQTFVLGVGAFPGDGIDYDPTFVGQLARAGGTSRTPTCNPLEDVDERNVCHFQVTPGSKTAAELRADVAKAIDAIRDRTLACDFNIDAPPAGFTLDAQAVSVRHTAPDGVVRVILPSAADGWSMDDANKPSVVSLNGQACRSFRETGGDVEILLACR